METKQHHLILEVQQLQLDVNLNKINQDILDSRTRENRASLNFILEEIEKQELVDVFGLNVELFSESIANLLHGLHELNKGSLSQDLIPTGSFQQAWPTLNSSANKLGGRVPLSSPDQLFGLPFSAFGINQQVMVIIHVPIVTPSDWNLHQLRRKPLLLPGGDNATVLVHIKPDEDLLAVSSTSDAYAILPDSTLDRCIKLGHRHLCETVIAFNNASQHCLSRLFTNNLRDLPHFCPVYLTKQEYAVVAGDNEWILFHRDFQPVTTSCLNGTRRTQQQKGYFLLPWSPGCTFSTPMFTLAGIPTPPSETLGATINLTPTLQDLIGFHIQEKEIEEMAKHHGFPSDSPRAIPFRELLRHRDHVVEEQHTHVSRWTFSALHGLLTITVMAMIGSLAFCTYRNFKTRQRQK